MAARRRPAETCLPLGEPAALLDVGVPDPLGDVREPALPAQLLDQADEVLVGEGVQPAEDLADHADERPRRVVVGRHGAEPVAGAQHGGTIAASCSLGFTPSTADGLADLVEALVVDCVGGALLALVGTRLEQELHEDVRRQHGPPGGADELARVVADRRVAVVGGEAEHRDVVVAELVQLGPDEVQVLAEPARPVGGGHQVGDLVTALVLDDAQQVAEDDLLRVALVAGRHAAAEVEGALVGVAHRPRVEADRADGGGQHVAAAVRHLRQVQLAALEAVLADRLPDPRIGDSVRLGQRRPPPRDRRAPRRPRPGTTSAGIPCCPGTPRSGS